MTKLSKLALENETLLRALADNAGADVSLSAFAAEIDRDPSNTRRAFKTLHDAGFIHEAAIADGLTEQGLEQLALLDRLEGTADNGDLRLRHAQLTPHPLNPRKDFDTPEAEEALDELRDSLLTKGQLQNLVIRPRPEPDQYWIIAGESRWRAIGQAIFDGDWEEDRPIRCELREVDDADHLMMALAENLQRRALLPIEEAHAFAAAVHEFGMKTEDLAHQIGKSQRYVQQRIALLKLSDDDQDRMRLPADHPDHLGFKAARALVTDSRPADAAPPAEPAPGAPGSPADAFDQLVSDKEAVMVAELVDAAERRPAPPPLDTEFYTRVTRIPPGGAMHDLIRKGVVAVRMQGGAEHARAKLFANGGREWLEGLGFYGPHRADVLFELRTRVVGADKARQLAESGRYLTEFLNFDAIAHADSPAEGEGPEGRPLPEIKPTPEDGAPGEAQSGAFDFADDQPDLIQPTAEEAEARRAREAEAHAAARAGHAVGDFGRDVLRWMANERASDRRDYLNPCFAAGPGLSARELADEVFGAVATGQFLRAGALLTVLALRHPGMDREVQRIPLPEIEYAMLRARTPDQPEEDDPAEDAPEGEEECADSDQTAEPAKPTEGQPQQPAVPIRKSITPDFIVCLEDGRKFKSLKRHLRTRYDLSPEEYRAKWGLPMDYPMVAPNYAKARADLARQMGAR